MKAPFTINLGCPGLLGKDLLIFDFDGTLADTTPLHAAAFMQVLAPIGISVDYPRIAGLKTIDAIRQCISTEGLELSELQIASLAGAKQRVVRGMMADGLEPLPGADAFLRRARNHFSLAMVTSGSSGTVNPALAKLGYDGWFDPLVCADDVAQAKPDPEGFLMALQLSGVSAERALVFEDSQAGFVAAGAAGLDYVDVVATPWSRLLEVLP